MKLLVAAVLTIGATPAAAEVVSVSPNGFEVRHTVNLVVKADVAFASFANVAGWWNEEHTYSGDPKNMSLDLRSGGCFCERIPESGGGIEHLHVTYVDPGKRAVLTGALGPLLYEAVAGVMDVQVKSTAAGSQFTLDYKVAGFANGGAEKLAPLVDQVLGEQMKRLRAYATARPRS